MGKRVLLADDSITIQKLVEMAFADTDFELKAVSDGQQAVDALDSFQPDIILADAIMPSKDGYEVCRLVKESDQFAQTPVVLLTGRFQPFDQSKADSVKIDGRVVKPFVQEQLVELIERLTGGSAGSAAPAPVAPENEVEVEEEPAPAPDEGDFGDETLVLDEGMSLDEEQEEQEDTRADVQPTDYDSHSTIRVNPDDLKAYLKDKESADGEAPSTNDDSDAFDLDAVSEVTDSLPDDDNELDASFDRSIESLDLDTYDELSDQPDEDAIPLGDDQLIDDDQIDDDQVEEFGAAEDEDWSSDSIDDDVFDLDEDSEVALEDASSEEPQAMELDPEQVTEASDDELEEFQLDESTHDAGEEQPLEERDTVSMDEDALPEPQLDELSYADDDTGDAQNPDDLSEIDDLSFDEELDESAFDEVNLDEPDSDGGSPTATKPLQLQQDDSDDVDFEADTVPGRVGDDGEPEAIRLGEHRPIPTPNDPSKAPTQELDDAEDLPELDEEDLITEPTEGPETSVDEEPIANNVGEDTLPGKNKVADDKADADAPSDLDQDEDDDLDKTVSMGHDGDEKSIEEEFGLDIPVEEPVFDAEEMGLLNQEDDAPIFDAESMGLADAQAETTAKETEPPQEEFHPDEDPIEVSMSDISNSSVELDIPIEEYSDSEDLGELVQDPAGASESEPQEQPPPLPPQSPAPSTTQVGALDDEAFEKLVNAVTNRIVERFGDDVIREIAWEVIPELAEAMIKQRIHELEKAAD